MKTIFNNIPVKPTTKRLPSKSSDILTAGELNKEYSLEKIIGQKAKEIYEAYILPGAKMGYKEVKVPFPNNKTFYIYKGEPIGENRDIVLFEELGKYFNNLGYETKIHKTHVTGNNGDNYCGLIVKW